MFVVFVVKMTSKRHSQIVARPSKIVVWGSMHSLDARMQPMFVPKLPHSDVLIVDVHEWCRGPTSDSAIHLHISKIVMNKW